MNNNIREWADRQSVLEMYAEVIMDSMDMKTMEQFVFDTLCENLSLYDDQELITEIRDTYGDEFFTENQIELPEVDS
jgi:hypothetical protein